MIKNFIFLIIVVIISFTLYSALFAEVSEPVSTHVGTGESFPTNGPDLNGFQFKRISGGATVYYIIDKETNKPIVTKIVITGCGGTYETTGNGKAGGVEMTSLWNCTITINGSLGNLIIEYDNNTINCGGDVTVTLIKDADDNTITDTTPGTGLGTGYTEGLVIQGGPDKYRGSDNKFTRFNSVRGHRP